jgi:hypothetical protein
MDGQADAHGQHLGLQDRTSTLLPEHLILIVTDVSFLDSSQAHRPTEKAFRPSHRAAVHGSILNDVSYFSLVELKGEEHALERVLRRVAGEVCWGKRSVRLFHLTLY